MKIKKAKAKNLSLTPASQATTNPPAAINKEVPRSGWVITKRTGAIKATTGVNKNFNLNEYKSRVPPYGKYFCSGHPSPNANRELTKIILKYIDENNIWVMSKS